MGNAKIFIQSDSSRLKMSKINTINDCVIRFANINGTGSASANHLFAKAIFRLGVPVSPKNIFPSNIQGLPTWYEIRVNEQGHLGRREDIDFIVAANGQTFQKDYESVRNGGYFLFDSSKPLPHHFQRNDIQLIGIPLTDIANREYADPSKRLLFKNIIYVGALAALFDMEFDVFTQLIQEQFQKKEKLIAPNIHALELGYDYATTHFSNVCELKIQRRELNNHKILIDGNAATALGAIYSGATFAAWYPITPSTSVVEAFEKYCLATRVDQENQCNNYAIIQAEDELSAMGMVIGAAWNGARAFTATSGPGLSLMSEFIGLGYFAEIPAVLVDVQRTGPSTGMPTRTQQSDILSAAYASHGDTKHVLLFPSSPKECFDMSAQAFDLADRLQTPIIIMSDLDLGMNDHLSEPFTWDDQKELDRGKVLSAQDLESLNERWGRYLDKDNDGIGYRTYPGTHPEMGSYFTRGSSHDEYAAYTEDTEAYVRSMQRLLKKWNTAKTLVPKAEIFTFSQQAKLGALFFGTSTASSLEALELCHQAGISINGCRLTSFPFDDNVQTFIEQHQTLFIIEQNRDSQMRCLLMNELNVESTKLIPIVQFDGLPITAHHILQHIEQYVPKASFLSSDQNTASTTA